jgi:hypothetical protein
MLPLHSWQYDKHDTEMVHEMSLAFNQLIWLPAWNYYIIFIHHESFRSCRRTNVHVHESDSYLKALCLTYLNRYILCNLTAVIVDAYIAWERFTKVDISETQIKHIKQTQRQIIILKCVKSENITGLIDYAVAMLADSSLPTFQSNIPPPSSRSKSKHSKALSKKHTAKRAAKFLRYRWLLQYM